MGTIDLKKISYNSSNFSQVIDNEFKTFGIDSYSEEIKNLPTVKEFFEHYDLLFYEIPIDGDISSHSYLAKKSGEYSEFDKDFEIIKALQDEISNLREENLNQSIKILELETGQKLPSDITSSLT